MASFLNQKRFGLLVLALVFAGLALALPTNPTGESSAHRVTGVYQSELLDDEVSIPALSAFTYTEEFQDLVGATVRVEAVRESPFHIEVTTELPTDVRLLTAHKRAIHLLSAEVKEQAMREVKTDLEYLEETRRKAARLRQTRQEAEARIALARPERSTEVLSAKDSQRLIFLKEEIKNLEAFLDGGPLSKTVRARLDRESLNAAEKRLRNQQAELSRLAKLFHPSSKAIQAQRGSVEAAQSDLAEIERQLAEIYHRALRLELETLDDKASSRIHGSLASAEKENAAETSDIPVSTGSTWLDDRQKELEARGEAIGTAASLKLEGKLVFSVVQANTQLWTVSCWLVALLFFLLAVFSTTGHQAPISVRPGKETQQAKRTPTSRRIELASPKASNPPDQLERFFDTVCSEITDTLKRPPRRLLVLGDSDTEARLAFSIRLANSLGRQAERVRLIDFDFRQKSLSERLGRLDLPGVSELILYGGHVDEFFSSISGTRIQFAPAGKISSVTAHIEGKRVSDILGTDVDEVTIIDASCHSPLELLVNQIEGVLWVTRTRDIYLEKKLQQSVLSSLNSADIAMWEVDVETMDILPLQ